MIICIKQNSVSKIVLGLTLCLFQSCNLYYKAFYTEPNDCYNGACQSKPYDVIIVPGFPSDSGRMNGVLAERISWANYLYKNGFTKNIIFSGAAVYSPYVEAKVMRLYAIQIGIPPEVIFTETQAEHTTENLYYGYELARGMGFQKIAFASQAAQTSFMKPFRRKFKLQLDFIPIVSDTLTNNSNTFKELDASSALKKDFISIEKRQSKLQRLRGTRGHFAKKAIRKAKRTRKKKQK